MRLKQLMISKYIAERDKMNGHSGASPLFCSRSGSTPRAPGALLAMMEGRSGRPLGSERPATVHQPSPRTPQKLLLGRNGPQ